MPARLFRLIFLLIATVAVQSSTPVVAIEGDPVSAPSISVTVEPAAAQAGETVELYVELNRPGGMSTLLGLEITYADGATQQVLGSTIGSAATLSWEIPPGSVAGPAMFRLTTSDCGCGDRSMRVQNVLPPGVVEGAFVVGK
jgi:hypothetical protein